MPGAVEPRRARWVEMRGVIEKDRTTNPFAVTARVLDITDRKTTEHAMERLAFYDSLTGLPNRTNGMMLAQQMLDSRLAGRRGGRCAVCGLRPLQGNQRHPWHIVGDNVLSELAARFRSACARTTSMPAWVAMNSRAYKLAPGEDPLSGQSSCSTALGLPAVSVDSLKFDAGASIGGGSCSEHGDGSTCSNMPTSPCTMIKGRVAAVRSLTKQLGPEGRGASRWRRWPMHWPPLQTTTALPAQGAPDLPHASGVEALALVRRRG